MLDWAETFGPVKFLDGVFLKKPRYCTDRIWRIWTLLAPSGNWKRETDFFGSDFPFSVKVETKVTAQDIFKINRDHYEGSELDLTKGVAAGPYGSPIRYDPGFGLPGQDSTMKNENNMTLWDRTYGLYPRAIAIMRTSWHFVAVSRPQLHSEVGGLLWFSQYQPSAGAYAPLYISAETLPQVFTRGTLYEVSHEASFWKFCLVGNYMQLAWKYIYPDVKTLQEEVENAFVAQLAGKDRHATHLIDTFVDGRALAVEYLTKVSDRDARLVFDEWGALFWRLVGKYHDGYIMVTNTETIHGSDYFYPMWWLVMTDFYMNVVGDKYWKAPGGWENLQNVFGEVGGGAPNRDEKKKRAFWSKLLFDEDPPVLGSSRAREGGEGSVDDARRGGQLIGAIGKASFCVAVGFFVGKFVSEKKKYNYTIL